MVATAHSHDFQRRRRVDPLSGETTNAGLQYMDDDSTDEDDDDDDRDDGSSTNNAARFSDVELPSQTSHIDSGQESLRCFGINMLICTCMLYLSTCSYIFDSGHILRRLYDNY